MKNKNLLVIWIMADLIWSLFLFSSCGYVVFWKGYSGWWFVLASLLCYQPTLFKVLKKEFEIND